MNPSNDCITDNDEEDEKMSAVAWIFKFWGVWLPKGSNIFHILQ